MPKETTTKKMSGIVVGLLRSTADVTASTWEVTRQTTAASLRRLTGARGDVPRVVAQVLAGAIRAGSETGAELGAVAKSAMIGTAQGVGEVSKVTTRVFRDAARAAVSSTAEAGGDVAKVATKVVEGAIEASKQTGLRAEDAASAAAAGAIDAAAELGDNVARAVSKALSRPIIGVRVALATPARCYTVLIADSTCRDLELLSQQVSGAGYSTRSAASLDELDQLMQEGNGVSLALIDISGFDRTIWERCARLHEAKIPFIVISPQRSREVQQESLRCCASGLLIKPIAVQELLRYLRDVLGRD